MQNPEVLSFFDSASCTFSYILVDPATQYCAIIDSVLGFDMASGRTCIEPVEQIIDCIKTHGYKLEWILETHVHADHLSAAPMLQERLGGKIAISEEIKQVQNVFGKVFNAGTQFQRDGSQFDLLLADNQTIPLGELTIQAIHTPGHTPACMTFLCQNTAFVGDTLFMPDFGTARTDFPGGDAAVLFHSIQVIYQLPDDTKLFMCHDYKAPGRDEYANVTTVLEQKQQNIHVNELTQKHDFVEMRNKRDASLSMPKLILPSVQVNMRGGDFPEPEGDGQRYLKIPLDVL